MVKLPNLTNIMLFSNDERVLGVMTGEEDIFLVISKRQKKKFSRSKTSLIRLGTLLIAMRELPP